MILVTKPAHPDADDLSLPQLPAEDLASDLELQTALDKDRISDLIDTIKESADKLKEDRTSRGDLKILSRALRELRYAFKVFSPYRDRRKVTIFGSARTAPAESSYQQAVKLGQAMAEQKWLVVTGAASGIMEAGHRGAGRENQWRELLVSFAWLERKTGVRGFPAVLLDLAAYSADSVIGPLYRACRPAAHIVTNDPAQV